VVITLTDKDVPIISANNFTKTYDGNAVVIGDIAGKTATVNSTDVAGEWSFDGSPGLIHANSGLAVNVKFTPTDGTNYETVYYPITVTINKATPTGAPSITPITTSGKTLDDATLAIGSITPTGGALSWDLAASTPVTPGTSYAWTYIPANTANYNNLTGSTVLYSVGGGGGGSTTPSDPVSNEPVPGAKPPANISNTPVKGNVVDTPAAVEAQVTTALEQNPGFVPASGSITLAPPPAANKGLTPVSVPGLEGIDFTALVSPNADGSFTPVPFYVGADGTVFVLIDDGKTILPVNINLSYGDVESGDWFAGSVAGASALGIVIGDGTNFRPEESVSTQDTLTMFLRAIGTNSDYTNVLQTALAKGIGTAGLSGSAPAPRSLAALLISDTLKAVGISTTLTADEQAALLADFTDLDGLTPDELAAFAVAVKYGLLNGMGGGEMSPGTTVNRAQMAAIAVRINNLLIK
jgi:hypothetical protein